jgi:hypothetical protein
MCFVLARKLPSRMVQNGSHSPKRSAAHNDYLLKTSVLDRLKNYMHKNPFFVVERGRCSFDGECSQMKDLSLVDARLGLL